MHNNYRLSLVDNRNGFMLKQAIFLNIFLLLNISFLYKQKIIIP